MLATADYPDTVQHFCQAVGKIASLSTPLSANSAPLLQALIALLDDPQVVRFVASVPYADWPSAPAKASTPVANTSSAHWIEQLFYQLLANPITDKKVEGRLLTLLCSPTMAYLYHHRDVIHLASLIDPLCQRLVTIDTHDTTLPQYHQLLLSLIKSNVPFSASSAAQTQFLDYCVQAILTHSLILDARLVIYYTFSQLLEWASSAVVAWVRALPQASKVYKALVTQVSQSNSSLIILSLHCLNLLLRNDALGAKIFSPSNLKETLRLVFHMTARAERADDLITAILLIKNLLQSPELRAIVEGHPPLNHALKQTFEIQWHEQERFSEVLLLATTLMHCRISTTTVLSLVHDSKMAADFLQAMVKTANAHRMAGELPPLFTIDSETWWPPLQYPECTNFLVVFAEHLPEHDDLEFAHAYHPLFRALLLEILQVLLPNPDSYHLPLPPLYLLDSMLELLARLARTPFGTQLVQSILCTDLNDCLIANFTFYSSSALHDLCSDITKAHPMDQSTAVLRRLVNFTTTAWCYCLVDGIPSATVALQNSSQGFANASSESSYGLLAQISQMPSTEPLVHLLYGIISSSTGVFLAYQRAVGQLQVAHSTANQKAAERDTQQRQQYQMEIERLHESLREKLCLEESRQQQHQQLEQEMQSWREKADNLNHQVAALQAQVTNSTKVQQNLQTAHDVLLHQQEAQSKSLTENENTIRRLQTTIHELEQELQMSKEDFGLQEERWAKTVRQLRSKTTQNQELESTSRSLESEITQLQRDNACLRDELTQLPIVQQAVKSAHERISELEACNDQQQQRIQELQQAAHADAADKTSLEAQVKNLTHQTTISQAECQRHLETVRQYEARLHCQAEELQQHDKIAELMIDLYRNKPRLRAHALPDVDLNPNDVSAINWEKAERRSAYSHRRSSPLNFGVENIPTQPYTPAVPTPTPSARGYATHQL